MPILSLPDQAKFAAFGFQTIELLGADAVRLIRQAFSDMQFMFNEQNVPRLRAFMRHSSTRVNISFALRMTPGGILRFCDVEGNTILEVDIGAVVSGSSGLPNDHWRLGNAEVSGPLACGSDASIQGCLRPFDGGLWVEIRDLYSSVSFEFKVSIANGRRFKWPPRRSHACMRC
jgi:hypothetical protein